MICAKHLFVFPSIAQGCGLSHSLPELFPSNRCLVERFVLQSRESVEGHWSDFSLMSCDASCKSRKSCYSLHLLPEALERLGTRFPSLCRSAAFSALSLPFLFWPWASWQRSDFGAHSSLHTVKGSCKRVGEKVRKEKKSWGKDFFLGGSFAAPVLKQLTTALGWNLE